MAMISRRKFIKLAVGAGGLTAVAIGGFSFLPPALSGEDTLHPGETLRLSMEEVLMEMVDLKPVYMWAFQRAGKGPAIPGPAIFVQEGNTVDIAVTNNLAQPHAFSIPGVVASELIQPGQTVRLSFSAPRAGTYAYVDPLDAPINRVMGLHGVMVVTPKTGNTPYSNPTPEVQQLFDDLGSTPEFPGDPWRSSRSLIWILGNIDPVLSEAMQERRPVGPDEFVRSFLPRYFTINGKSGFFAAHDPDIAPHGKVGQPELIRVFNAGLANHSLHIHGNHVFHLATNGQPRDNVFFLDTWTMRPLETKDVLLPFVKPPDIPDQAWPPAQEKFPLKYPMHCHVEMSQTSGGGNYPQGLMTDWKIDGPLS